MEEPAVLDPADARPEVRQRLCDWLALQRVLALRPRDAKKWLQATGGAREALAASGLGPPPPADQRRALARLRACGAVCIPQLSPAFPSHLARLEDPPLLLHVRGDVAALKGPCVAVVGPRAPSAGGRFAAELFAEGLARAGAVVVSGLANGIDGVAHRAALAVGGKTIAVQACGPDLVYPRRHRELAEQIAASGAVVSELPPGAPPRREHFPFRNRVISALSRGLLVVEARVRSGSLVTARHAADQGVDVWAVPGPLGAPTSEGTNRLLRDGAFVALEPADLLLPLGLAPPAAPSRLREPALPPHQRAIVAALREGPASVDELGQRLAAPPELLAKGVLELELGGAIAQDRDGRLCIVRPRSGGR